MKKPLLSVVLPFYDGAPFLEEAAGSVLDGSFSEIEVVLVDDGSTDGSRAIADAFARKDERVRIVEQEHEGLVPALNSGIAHARSDLIARMDADDVCHPDRFRIQRDFLDSHPDISAVSCLVEPISNKPITDGTRRYVEWLNRSVSPEQIARDLYIESPLPHPSVTYRRSAVESVGGYRAYDGPEDYDLWLRMACAGHSFAKVPQHLLKWRFHDGNLSRRDPRYRKKAFLDRKLEFVVQRIEQGPMGAERTFRICGPGKAGRRLHGFLKRKGIQVEAFVDVNPHRGSASCRGIPVLPPGAIGRSDTRCFYFCAVQRWSSWDELRAMFGQAGKEEGADYVVL
jgi:glycosyltransferase involved in cell wall biosynthesis